MTLFDIIYNWFKNYIFSTDGTVDVFLTDSEISLFGQTFNLSEWLSIFCTLVVLALVVVFFIKVTIWIFKFFGGLIKW